MPILSDLVRGDAILLSLTDNSNTAIVRAVCQPATVPTNGPRFAKGAMVNQLDEPAILRALSRGTPARRSHQNRHDGPPTVQEVYPIRDGTRIVGALTIETGVVERDRQHRKSIVFRRALERLRRQVAAGNVQGALSLGRLDEYDGPMVVTTSGQIVYISSLAEQLYRKVGYSDSLLGRNVTSLQTDESAFLRAVESGSCVEQIVQEGEFTWQRRAIPLAGHDSDQLWSRVIRQFEPPGIVIVTTHDVTDETRRERELRIKSAMIQEIHHRVKNNLQTIAALLRIQARRTGSPEVGAMLHETIDRILSISYVHDLLARQESNEVDLREVAQQIICEVSQGILGPEKQIRFVLDAPNVSLPSQQATSCSLVLNELLHNTVEHGFPTGTVGNVNVRIEVTSDRIVMEVTDNGTGLPAGFDLRVEGSLGLQIVQTLVRDDLKGTFQLMNIDGRGAKGIVSFPRVG